jgi:hypothetical protein
MVTLRCGLLAGAYDIISQVISVISGNVRGSVISVICGAYSPGPAKFISQPNLASTNH